MEAASDSDSPSDSSLVSRRVFALDRRLARLERELQAVQVLLQRCLDRVGRLEESLNIAELDFRHLQQNLIPQASLAQEARYQAALARLEVCQLAERLQRVERALSPEPSA